MKAEYVLAHDVGTGGNKTVICDKEGKLLATAYHPYPTIYPQPGWAEQAPLHWWKAVVDGTRSVVSQSGIDKSKIACISFSHQMLGVVPVDKKGNLLRDTTIIWFDSRSVPQTKRVFKKVERERWYQITGAGLRPELYSGFKLMWLKENEPDLFRRAHTFLGTKDYIILRLTGQFPGTTYSDATGSGLFDLETWDYCPELVDASELPREKLPPIHQSTHVTGELLPEPARELGLPAGIPVVIGGADTPCTALAAGNVAEGRCCIYIGSSGWVSVASDKPFLDSSVPIYVFGHVIPRMYTSEVATYSAGNSYRWVRDNICHSEIAAAKTLGLDPYDLMGLKADSSPVGAQKLLFISSLAGGATNPNLRGGFLGLSLGHTKADLIRAAMEGISLELRLLFDKFRAKGVKPAEMRVVGGGAKSRLWRQILADVYNTEIVLTNIGQEAAALGAAIVGGVAVGLWKDFTVVDEISKVISVSEPNPENVQKYEEILPIFKLASEQMGTISDRLAELQ